MSTHVVDRVEDWADRSFSGGYRRLHDLADKGFSGVVRAGGAELYMTKGVVVGIRRGTIEDFEGARGTVYEAPSPALPLLAIMQERSEDVRDNFYSEKTPISEVDGTLSDGGFTGYIELSENVLSGDYYLVYHAGESMSVGFVGESRRLIHGDEAFETADDEVGIYEVRPVDIERIEIPEPEEPATQEPAADPSGGSDTADEPSDESDAVSTDEHATQGQPETDRESTREVTTSADADPDGDTGEGRSEPQPSTVDRDEPTTGRREQAASERRERRSDADQSGPDSQRGRDDATGPAGGPGQDRSSGAGDGLALERRAIPSLDPTRTETSEGGTAQRSLEQPREREPRGQRTQPRQAADPAAGTAGGTAARETVDPERVETLEATIQQREEEIDRLEDELESVSRERDDLRDQLETVRGELDQFDAVREERDQLEAEVERLQSEVDRLESEIERLEGELGTSSGAGRRITSEEALSGTDIFFRYYSKGDATLEKAHGSSTRKDAVNENLRLEKHTQFDAEAVTVGGQPYGQYLERTVEYQFVEWLVRELLFEIRETGHRKELKDLYDVLPAVDRAELAGVVEAVYTTDGQETRSQEAFDVILRDRMGNPLLVANMNDSREAATASMMEDLITSAERVGQSAEEFAGAFLVTRSFFDPGALEVAEEATQGGLLSRNKRESFVNLSRKRGYHLCLVEARNQNFHLAVPEL